MQSGAMRSGAVDASRPVVVGANGGIMSKYSVGVYSTTPVQWKRDRSAELQTQIAAAPTVAVTEHADGPGTIETYTVRRDNGRLTGVIIGRLDADNSRFLATTEDDELIALLTDGEPLGQPVCVRSLHYGNRCSLP
jgi:acetyl-CoA C-acetyltransferase